MLFSSFFSLILALTFCSFWEAQSGAKHCFYISKHTFAPFEKVIVLTSFLDAKSRPRTSKYLTFSLYFPIYFYITKRENIKSVWYTPRFVRVRVLYVGIFSIDGKRLKITLFCAPLGPLLAHSGRSRDPPNRHLTFKNDALA